MISIDPDPRCGSNHEVSRATGLRTIGLILQQYRDYINSVVRLPHFPIKGLSKKLKIQLFSEKQNPIKCFMIYFDQVI